MGVDLEAVFQKHPPLAPAGLRRRRAKAADEHAWSFRPRFRRHALGWRGSREAVERIDDAWREIKQVARRDPVLAADGAITVLERVCSAFGMVDGSSGALGGAVCAAIAEAADLIAAAPADHNTRMLWIERLWLARVGDEIGFLDYIENCWGTFCGTNEVATWWVDATVPALRVIWATERGQYGYREGITACFSALLKAERYDEILALLELPGAGSHWSERMWGFRALVEQGHHAEAIRYAEESNSLNAGHSIARACEELLLASGMADEAYERYAFRALREESTYLGTFRAMSKRYPMKDPEVMLADLAATTPGREGKWFAAAKSAGFYDLALRLANTSPCDPKTLARAARDFAENLPEFAIDASLASLRWMAEGYGYELTDVDVRGAYSEGKRAAERLDRARDFDARAIAIVTVADAFVRQALRLTLGLPDEPPSRSGNARRGKKPRG